MNIKKTFLYRLKSNRLIQNSFIFFLGSISASAGNYIFHLIIARILGPADYGILSSLISLSVILAIPISALGIVSTKLASNIKVSKDYGALHSLIKNSLKNVSLGALVLFLIFCFFASTIAHFLKIASSRLIILLAVMLFISFSLAIMRGILQGLQNFKILAFNMIAEPIVKIGIGVTLVLTGLKVYGALGGMIVAICVAFILTIKPLWFAFSYKPKNNLHIKKVILYALPVLASLFCFTLLYNIDIIMVKHFFSDEEAGLYSALAKLGQIIFFGTSAITTVMFSMVAEKYKRGEAHHHLLIQTLSIVGGASILGVIVYFIFPNLLIKILFGSAYLAVAPLVGLFALAMSFLSLNNVLINYFLSIHKFKFIYFLAAGSLLETFLIIIRHQSIKQIALNIFVSLAVLFIGLITFYAFGNKKSDHCRNS